MFGEIAYSEDRSVQFKDDRHEAFDAIVLATGYRPALDKLIPDADERFDGSDSPGRGRLHPDRDGLYFCGFNAVPTGHLRQIGKEAEQIAVSIHDG